MNASQRRSNCPLNVALELFGDKWSLLILRDMLIVGKSRYGEFLDSPEGISTNILADRLKQLACCGLVEKLRDPANGKTSLYLPTAMGVSLLPLLLEVIRWGLTNLGDTGVPEFVLTALRQGPDQLIAECETRLHNERLTLAG